MRKVKDWDEYYMDMAFAAKERSKDPSTQVGAYLVDRFGTPISAGYNGFLPGFPDTPDNWERPFKYEYVVHAEANAVGHAARRVLQDGTVYVTAMPCSGCIKSLISSGVSRIVHGPPVHGWDKEHEVALLLANMTDTEMTEL